MKFLKNFFIALCLLLIGGILSMFIAVRVIFPKFLVNETKTEVDTETISDSTSEENSEVLDKTAEIKGYIDSYFIGEYDEGEMADSVAEAMIAATGDRWSYYISEADYASYQEQMNNSYVGIGITILKQDDESVLITDVTKGGPAYESGVKDGDYLLFVGDKDVKEMTVLEIRNLVRGEEGTSIELTFSRDDSPYILTIVRKTIETEVASYEMLDNQIGYIIIDNFDSNAASYTIGCIESAIKDGADALIFDVRFNPGGYKHELVEILDYLLPEGPLFRTKDYAGNETVDSSDASCLDIPIAVLINEDSYSAAEFFAAAIQEYDAGEIVGTATCGKGYFQCTYQLSDGSAIALSSGTYYTPNGISLIGTGVLPDIEIEIPDEEYADLYYGLLTHEEDTQLQAAIQYLLENKP